MEAKAKRREAVGVVGAERQVGQVGQVESERKAEDPFNEGTGVRRKEGRKEGSRGGWRDGAVVRGCRVRKGREGRGQKGGQMGRGQAAANVGEGVGLRRLGGSD